jgi:hypothetical protein
LARGEFHIQEIERLIKNWAGPKSYKIAMEADSQGGLELVGTQLQDFPDTLGLVIGDALEAMRSSLDNLAYVLALKCKTTLTADEERDVSYPIFDAPPAITSRSVKHMTRAAQLDIIGLYTYPTPGRKEDDLLWLLDKTNNRDKHRVITVAAADVSNYQMNMVSAVVNGPSQIGIGGPHRTLKTGDRNVFSRFGPGSQVQFNMSARLQIVFDQGIEVADREVAATLRAMHDYIRDTVFQALEKHL